MVIEGVKRFIRNRWAPLHYALFPNRVETRRVSGSGGPLARGITGCLTVKDEALCLSYTLPNFARFFDQVVCVDNGSTDGSLEMLRQFQQEQAGTMDVEVISMPDAPFLEAKNEGLRHVRYRWFCVLDADMLILPAMLWHRVDFLDWKIPSAVRCPRVQLAGDLRHTNRFFEMLSTGEYFLRHFSTDFHFREVNLRNTHAIIPRYYRFAETPEPYMVHLDCAKPNERLFFRASRMDYRQYLNSGRKPMPFDEFEQRWLKHLLQTEEPSSAKYRSARLQALLTRRLTIHEQAVMSELRLDLPGFPFEVVEVNDEPFLRLDHRDDFWNTFQPTTDDIDYKPPNELYHNIEWRLSPFR